MSQTLVLASRNKDKIKELRQTLSNFGIELKSSYDFPGLDEVVEDKETLQGNALKKARYTFQKTGIPSLSDDTGLEVDALKGRPGVYSARYSGENATYQQNTQKLLRELDGIDERSAQFRTVVALVTENGEQTFEGICRGEILHQPQGSGGFGYDPVFRPGGYQQTFAELDGETKNSISHRGKAVEKFISWIQKYISGNNLSV